MGVFVALLRGINVSGKNIIKMAALKHAFNHTALSEFKTYLQSGNLIFRSEMTDSNEIADLISEKIKSGWGYQVKVKVIRANELQRLFKENPFVDTEEIELKQLYYIHTLGKIDSKAKVEIEEDNNISEDLSFADEIVYVNYNKGYGRSKITHSFFERKLKIPVTARNHNTMRKLVEIAKDMSV